jgi:patatin-like phospholipase/acyl hydrolase
MRKILAIDGGGIKGAFPAAFLARLEERLNQPIGRYFDLIAGTSTGGIIALWLGAGGRAADILSFYESHGPEVFRAAGRLDALRHWFSGKHSAQALRAALEEKFQSRLLGDSLTRLIIPSLSLETGKVHIFKTAHHPRLQTDYRRTMVDVALATSAAPSYFPVHRTDGSALLIDGGLWANNPVGIASVEAVAVLNWPRDDVEVFSISCTGETYAAGLAANRHMGKLYWANRLLDTTSAGQSSAAIGTAQVLFGRDHVHRVEPMVARGTFALDDVSTIERLKGLADLEAREQVTRLSRFFEQVAEPFEPHYRAAPK